MPLGSHFSRQPGQPGLLIPQLKLHLEACRVWKGKVLQLPVWPEAATRQKSPPQQVHLPPYRSLLKFISLSTKAP
jgi:hypothetical protein